jgi:hypothetical protein
MSSNLSIHAGSSLRYSQICKERPPFKSYTQEQNRHFPVCFINFICKAKAHKYKTRNRDAIHARVGLKVIAQSVLVLCKDFPKDFQNLYIFITFQIDTQSIIFLPNFRSSVQLSPDILNGDINGSHATRTFSARKA